MERMSHWFYITPEEYAEAALQGIRPALLEVRIRTLAWSKDRAIHTPPHEKHSLCDWVDVAKQHGIRYSTLRYRINRLGWEPERAATQPLQDRGEQAKRAHEASRKYAPEWIEQAQKNGISADLFRHRMQWGWGEEKACTTPVMTSREIGLMTKDKRSRGLCRFFLKKPKAQQTEV